MESIHRQTYKNREHIVVDGGSDDGTLDILKMYKEKGWISHLVSEKDSGIYEALNKGVALSRGEYINVMNTDDYFVDNNFFERSINEIENRHVDFSHADKIVKSRTGKQDFIKKGDERVAFFQMPFRHQTMIVKKDVYRQVGLFDESYKIAADYKWCMMLLLMGKRGIHIPKVFVCSLDGGVSSDRERCITEVSRALYECYGREYRLTLGNCKDIYTKVMSPFLFLKILLTIKNKIIRDSLVYGYKGQKRLIPY